MKRFNFVIGERNKGKTSYLKTLSRTGKFKGILTLSTSKEKDELYILNLETGETLPFMKRTPEGPYKADEETFRKVNSYITSIEEGEVILDECGRIELKKEGFYPSLLHLVQSRNIISYIAVRDTNLDDLIALLDIDECDFEIIKI